MIDTDRGDRQQLVLPSDLAGCELHRLHGTGSGRQEVAAVVGNPVLSVELVGPVETVHHRVDACRTIHFQTGFAALHPTVQVDVGQASNVVGVKVGQKHAL